MSSQAYITSLITQELNRNKTNPGWRGHGIDVRRNQFSLTPDLREQVQEIGRQHGCHTCLTRLEIDSDQPWVGDHIPPTKLTARDKAKIMGPSWRGKTYLYPQCHECSHQQSAIVDALKRGRMRFETLKRRQKELIGAVRTDGADRVRSSGPKVTADEAQAIQDVGVREGCHSCGTRYPVTTYHADHSFPQEFCTSYMEAVFKNLGLEYPDTFDLRPQCPRCSGHQGGKIKQIRDEAMKYATAQRLPVYKF